jgi:hypothetical protein
LQSSQFPQHFQWLQLPEENLFYPKAEEFLVGFKFGAGSWKNWLPALFFRNATPHF